jgi:hypothetical protein
MCPIDDDDGMGGAYMLGTLILMAGEAIVLLVAFVVGATWLGLLRWP